MILTLKKNAKDQDIKKLEAKIRELGFAPHIDRGKVLTVIGVIGSNAIASREVFEAMDAVDSISPISKPYKLVSREFRKKNTVINIPRPKGTIEIGGKGVVVMAGPCSVESLELLLDIGKVIRNAGAVIIRGGAFKPRTSPYAFQGLGEKGLQYLSEVREKFNVPVITEVMAPSQVKLVEHYADIIQIGARNIQNFDLLKEAGKSRKPVMLKRGMAATIEETLMSAEYILAQGNYNVMLCERGIRTFETATRFTLDLNAVPVFKQLTHLPVIVDPSHGVGVRNFVAAMAKASVTAGADGLIIEVHTKPEEAKSDGGQSLFPQQFVQLMAELKSVAHAVGRTIIKK
ncbi:MAG: 3-deoxy-7-phosphoheptulonate synthase [bacterium]